MIEQGKSVVNHDKSHDRTWQHVVNRDTVMSDKKLGQS